VKTNWDNYAPVSSRFFDSMDEFVKSDGKFDKQIRALSHHVAWMHEQRARMARSWK